MDSITHAQKVWSRVLDELRARLTESQFTTWFGGTTCSGDEQDGLVVSVRNAFSKEWIEERYRDVVREAAAQAVAGPSPRIRFVAAPLEAAAEGAAALPVARPAPTNGLRGARPAAESASVEPAPAPAPAATPEPRPRAAGGLQLNANYTFENFVVGPSNHLAHAAALSVIEGVGCTYNPLFIHGGLGLGKTHLLQAICHALIAQNRDVRLLYMPCEHFINQFISALSKKSVEGFRERYRRLDVLLIDDIHFLADKEHTQEEFFHTFNSLYNDQKQIILSSDSHASEIPQLEERLVSRFRWGFTVEIEQPTYETRLAIVRKKCQKANVPVPDDVIEYLASSVRANIRELEGAVTRLIGFARLMNAPVNLETARTALGDLATRSRRRVPVDRIIAAITEHYDVRLSDLQSKKRFQSIAFARQICMFLIRKLTDHSLSEIGGYFGGRDHTTVVYSVEKIRKRAETDPELAAFLDEVTRSLES